MSRPMRADEEFSEYIARAERRLASLDGAGSQRLRDVYEALKVRFRQDLGDGRDLLVSRAAALMFAETFVRHGGAAFDLSADSEHSAE